MHSNVTLPSVTAHSLSFGARSILFVSPKVGEGMEWSCFQPRQTGFVEQALATLQSNGDRRRIPNSTTDDCHLVFGSQLSSGFHNATF